MKNIFKITAVVLCILLMNSCVRQRYTSRSEFVKQFNESKQSVKLAEDGYYFKDNGFYYFSKLGSSRNIMISLEQNEKLNIICAQLTVTKSDKDLTESEKSELLKIINTIISVICNCSEEKACTELEGAEFTCDKLAFTSNNEQFTLLDADCFLCTNEELLSFSAEIK